MSVLTDENYELLVEYAKGTCGEDDIHSARTLLRESPDAQAAMDMIRPVEATMKQMVDLSVITDERLEQGWDAIQRSRMKNTNRMILRFGFAGALSAAVIALIFFAIPEPIGSAYYVSQRQYALSDTKNDSVYKGQTLITDNWCLSIVLDSGVEFSVDERSEITTIDESHIGVVSGSIGGAAGEEAFTLDFADCSLMVEPESLFSLTRDEAEPRIWKVSLNRGGVIQCEDGTVFDIPEDDIFVFSR